MKPIVITASESAWQAAQKSGEYTYSTIASKLEDVGFIHATFPDQTIDMINRHFQDRDDVVLLVVDPQKVVATIKYEAALSGRPGTFPHIYGPLNTDAVTEVIRPEKDQSGTYISPDPSRF